MKKIISAACVAGLFFGISCTNPAKKAKEKKLKDLNTQIEQMHNKSMASYVQLELYLDSLQKLQTKLSADTLKKMEQKSVSTAYDKAKAANQAMSDWMSNFNGNFKKMKLDSQIAYLDAQVKSVKAVEQSLVENLALSKKTMADNRDTTQIMKKDSLK